MENKIERVKPIKITDTETNETFELDFNRESVKFAERKGFKIMEVTDYMATSVPDLFYYSFRMNHMNVSRQRTDAILEQLGGLTFDMINRLMDLYAQSGFTHVVNLDNDDTAKNSGMMVEM